MNKLEFIKYLINLKKNRVLNMSWLLGRKHIHNLNRIIWQIDSESELSKARINKLINKMPLKVWHQKIKNEIIDKFGELNASDE